MVKSLFGVSIKYIRYHKVSFISSIVGIMISIALIINMFGLAANSEKMLMDEIRNEYGTLDMFITYEETPDKRDDVYKSISDIELVNEISRVNISYSTVDDTEIYTVAIDDNGISKSRYKYSEDLAKGYAVINEALANYLEVEIGDKVKVNGQDLIISETINNIVGNQSLPDMLIVNTETYHLMNTMEFIPTHLMIDVKDESNTFDCVKLIKTRYPNLLIDQIVEDEDIKTNLTSLNSFMTLLSFISLIMCALFLLSNFQLFLYNYRKQIAMLRAIGARTGQAFKTVFFYATSINLLGILLAFAFSLFSNKYIVPSLGKVLFNYAGSIDYNLSQGLMIVGISFILLEILMFIPAIKSTSILPIEINLENEKLTVSKWFSIFGGLFVLLAVVLYLQAIKDVLVFGANKSESVVGGIVSIIWMMIGFYLLFIRGSEKILLLLVNPCTKILGKTSGVALKTIIPQVKKNALIILSISTLVIITVLGSTLLETINYNNRNYLEKQFALDIALTNRDDTYNDKEIRNKISEIDSIENYIRFNDYFSPLVFDENAYYTLVNKVDIRALLGSDLIPKFEYKSSNDVIISKSFSKKMNINIGDEITLSHVYRSDYEATTDKESLSSNIYYVKAIGVLEFTYANILMDLSDEYFMEEGNRFRIAHIKSNNMEDTFRELELLKRSISGIKWTTLITETEKFKEMMYQRWQLFIIIIITIIMTLVVGSMNMLVNNILSRRSEYATLRLFKMTRIGFIKTILTQVLTYNLIGVVFGGILGIIFSNMLSFTDNGEFAQLNLSLALVILIVISILSFIIFIPISISLLKKPISEEIYESR